MLSYADRLSSIRFLGVCGDDETAEDAAVVRGKAHELARLIATSDRVVVFTGAGISTASGIPDFRGKHGVWTQQLKRRGAGSGTDTRTSTSTSTSTSVHPVANTEAAFSAARPSLTHWALSALVASGRVAHVVSQNVDCLHLRASLPRARLSELHGNVFGESCDRCKRQYYRDSDVGGMGLQLTGRHCDDSECGGELRDLTYDWTSPLPQCEFDTAIAQLKQADLCLVLGSSLRIRPAGNLPLKTKHKNGRSSGGKLVIVNLQVTHLDDRCELRIRGLCDTVMATVMETLGLATSVDEWKSRALVIPVYRPPLAIDSGHVSDHYSEDDELTDGSHDAEPCAAEDDWQPKTRRRRLTRRPSTRSQTAKKRRR